MQIQGVSEAVELRLREEIMTGRIAPGERINEIKVAERLGVSRPPLREALRRLEGENLIVSIPRKGSFVAKMSRDDCMQIYRARIMLECGAVDIIREQRSCDLASLERALDEEKRLEAEKGTDGKATDPHTAFLLLPRFHTALVKASGNRWVVHYYRQLYFSLGRYQIIYLTIPGESLHSRMEHDGMFDLLRHEKYEETKAAIRAHIKMTLDFLLPKISGLEK